MILWMKHEMERTNPVKIGGIIFDKMNIQPNLQFEPNGGGLRMFGGVDFGQTQNGIHSLLRDSGGIEIGTSIFPIFVSGHERIPFSIFVCDKQRFNCR